MSEEEAVHHEVSGDNEEELRPGHKLLAMIDNKKSFTAYRRASIAAREGNPITHEAAMAAASAAHEDKQGTVPRETEAQELEKRPIWEYWAASVKALLDIQQTRSVLHASTKMSVNADDSVKHALDFCRKNTITGVAVAQDGNIIGMLELQDILAAIVKQPRRSLIDELERKASVADTILQLPVRSVMCSNGRYTEMKRFAVDVPLKEPLSLLTERLGRYWRVGLEGNQTISQHGLIEHLSEFQHEVFLHQPLVETRAIAEHVLTVDASERTCMALAALIHFDAHVLAVRKGKKLIGEVSIYTLSQTLFDNLDVPIGNLMPKKFKLSTLHYSATLQKALEDLSHRKKHHVWITDRTHRIIGLLTASGLLRSMLK